MKLLMSVSSRNENDDGCVLACIDLTPGLAELALQRIESLVKLQARDQDADEIYYWNYDAVFFDPFLGPSHEGEPQDPLPRPASNCSTGSISNKKASSKLIRCLSFPRMNLLPSSAVR
jgi:hypothetical protein